MSEDSDLSQASYAQAYQERTKAASEQQKQANDARQLAERQTQESDFKKKMASYGVSHQGDPIGKLLANQNGEQ